VLEALATVEQEARFAVDDWEEPVRDWVGDRIDVGLSDTYWSVVTGTCTLVK
jgi:sulfur relay (sulfurtransferase) DsrC/TusE family protein